MKKHQLITKQPHPRRQDGLFSGVHKMKNKLSIEGWLAAALFVILVLSFKPPPALRRTMVRKPRVEFEGATYHVMCRGNRQAAIFKDDRKKVIAWYIRKKTGVKVEWITRRLHMGTPSNLARYVRAVEQSKEGFLWEQKGEMTS